MNKVDFLHTSEVRAEWNKGDLKSFLLWMEKKIIVWGRKQREIGFKVAAEMDNPSTLFEDIKEEKK